jgi:outer membrane protein OmpA-like peptidoglycan-associated protein
MALLAAGALLAAPRSASAQVLQRFALRAELGAGTMLTAHQRDDLGYNLAVQGSVRPAFSLVDFLALQAVFGDWYFPSAQGDGRSLFVGGGLRFEPRVGTVGRVFLDADVGAGLTGSFTRLAFDVGAGFEFAVRPWLGLGPALRYGRLIASTADVPSDPSFWSAGLSVAFRVPADAPVVAPPVEPVAPPAPPAVALDVDADGVADPDDVCVREPAGPRPDRDPSRRGCPLHDSDADGIYDDADACPTSPQGEHPDPTRAGCPDGDDDADGVTNHGDQCPAEPQGLQPDPTRAGCPAPDRDHDTVPDGADACPDRPGAPSPNPRLNGCPGLVQILDGQVRINRPVFFATNRDTILPRSFPVLQAVAHALGATPAIRRVAVEGHTDSVGVAARNLDLSQRRAESVRRWLVEHGADAPRLEAHGYGADRPLRPNVTSRDRAANRRVEFHIVDPAQPAASPRGVR